MHKKVPEIISTKREAKRKCVAAKAVCHDFSVGDFDLVSVDSQNKIPQ
jgi:hypothetical protein